MVPAAGMPQVSLLYIITPFWEEKNIKLLSFLYTKPILLTVLERQPQRKDDKVSRK